MELEQYFNNTIRKIKNKKDVGNNKKEKQRLFIANSLGIYNEKRFVDETQKMKDLFSYKKIFNHTLTLDNLSLISYCPKNENNEEFEIREFKMNHDSTIKGVFDHFESASTWGSDKKYFILFIKDSDSNIVSLTSIYTYGSYIYTIYKD